MFLALSLARPAPRRLEASAFGQLPISAALLRAVASGWSASRRCPTCGVVLTGFPLVLACFVLTDLRTRWAAAGPSTGTDRPARRPYAAPVATVLSVKERLKRQVGALDLVRQKAATVNDLTCSAAVQAAGELGSRALDVPVRVHREPDEDLVVVGLSVAAGGYEKHPVYVPAAPMTNDQYADYLEFRAELGPVEALSTVLEG